MMARLTPIAFVLAIAAAPLFAADPVTDAARDAAITARVETTFLLNEQLNPFNINTNTENGVVTLSGGVDDEIKRELAEDLARSVIGVEDVVNNIVIVPDTAVDSNRRSFKRVVEDKSITAAVRARLLYHKQLKGLKISVVTRRGVVTLSGVVANQEQYDRIAAIAFETKGVTEVVNALAIRPKDDVDQLQNVGRQFSDEWVEKRVETAIAMNRFLSVRQITVEVDDGVCILTGVVDSEEQRTLAGTVAESIQGVRTVDNQIQVHSSITVSDKPNPLDADEDALETLEPVEPAPPVSSKPLPPEPRR